MGVKVCCYGLGMKELKMKSKILNYLILSTSTIIFIVSSIAIFEFILHPSGYRFGTEVASWRYLSANHYLSLSIVEFGISALIIALSFFFAIKKKVVFQIILLVLVLISFIFL